MNSDSEPRSNSYSGVRVLVTGGAGAVGSVLTRSLLAEGAEVVVIDDLSSGYDWMLPAHSSLVMVRADILDEVALKRVFAERPTVVFHLAAFFANQQSVDYPERDLATNGLGFLRVLQYASMSGVRRLVYTSSSSVYGDSPVVPVHEDQVSIRLKTPYQITKLLGEMYGQYFNDRYDLEVVAVRLFNSYGPGEVPGQYRNVIPNFFFWAMNGQPLPITGTGSETREFTFVEDVASALRSCGLNDGLGGEVLNIAGGREVMIHDVAEKILALTGSKAGLKQLPSRRWDTKKRLKADSSRAKHLLNHSPTTALEDGLSLTHTWFIDHWDRISKAASFGPGISSALRP